MCLYRLFFECRIFPQMVHSNSVFFWGSELIEEWGGTLTTLLTLIGGSGATSDPLDSGLSSLLRFLPLLFGGGVFSFSSLMEKSLSQLLNTKSASTLRVGFWSGAESGEVVLEAVDGDRVGGGSRLDFLAGVEGDALERGLAARSCLALSCLSSVPSGAWSGSVDLTELGAS